MKHVLILLITLATGSAALAQEERPATLFDGRRNMTITGFGGPMLELSGIGGHTTLSVGGGGGVMFNRRFFIGGFGQGNATNTRIVVAGESRWIQHGQGGFWLGYRFSPNRLVNVLADARLGWAGVGLSDRPDDDDGPFSGRDRAFLATPSLGVELNVSRFMRIGLTGGYRFSSGLSVWPANSPQPVLTDADMRSPVGLLSFKFGWFE